MRFTPIQTNHTKLGAQTLPAQKLLILIIT